MKTVKPCFLKTNACNGHYQPVSIRWHERSLYQQRHDSNMYTAL